ncbi:MAG TPA: ABC transporter ATP-binding protein [Polyangiaceae bacterium]|nr:ABC transporter ATP-binding protein [Polyangiaceae bacterium]
MQKSSPIIRARHVSHSFRGTEVLHDISFDVRPGEIFGFIGPNGAGKTTTIRAMATLLEPASGRIEISGIDVGLEPERVRRKIGYMADQAGVYPKLTVEEYLAFFAAAYGLEPVSATDLALERTGFGSAREQLTGTLSKGMRQRLQLAKTLLHDPEVLILDEPASDLDPRARIEMRDLFVRLAEAGKTVFLSSHILTEMSDVCTSVGILEKGRLLTCGPLSQIVGPGGRTTAAPARRFKVRTLGPPASASAALRGIEDVTILASSGDQLTLGIRGGDDLVAAAVARLVEAGAGVIGLEPERDELETAFLELTKREPE